MADLISRVAAKEFVRSERGAELLNHFPLNAIIVLRMIDEIPSVDAVPVVRCHKCIFWDRETVRQYSNDAGWWNEAICQKDRIEKWTDADWFCADGERRDEDAAD